MKSFILTITDIERDGWNITCRWCQDSYIFPRDYIFPQRCALRENITPWENITLLAVHRNVIFHDRRGQYLYIINCIRHLSCGFTKLYSPRFKCQQGKEGNISYIPFFPFFTKAYGSLRVKKEGNIASGYFVIFITHRVRVCTENLRTSVAYCAFCNNGAQIGLRALYCDVIITPKAHCLQCIENFAKHWMHSAGLTMFLQLFMLRKPVQCRLLHFT